MIGQTISHYKILEKLGEGGMGVVYKAEDTTLKRTVALKFLPQHISTSENDKARFMLEAQAAAALNHPNICTIYAVEEHDAQIFIAMELIEGQTLKAKQGSITPAKAIDIGIQIAEGLSAAHEKGIVHRDIKPENIMVRKDGIVQIMDFGLAKLRASRASRLTKEGSTVGTAGFMSPEQIQGQDTDHRSDIFSLGVLLYELFTGELPFKGVHETALMYEIVNVDPAPMSVVKPDIDPELDRIVLECLQKDPDERYNAVKDIAKDLKRFKRESSRQRMSRVTASRPVYASSSSIQQSSAAVPALESKKSNMIPWIIAVVAVLSAVAVLLFQPKKIETPVSVIRTSILPAVRTQVYDFGSMALSPDGSMLVYGAEDSISAVLWLRPLRSSAAIRLQGTEGGFLPFWSPDNKFIGFFAGGKLKKIEATGGSAVTLCEASSPSGGSWNNEGTIIFTTFRREGIFKVSSQGGIPVNITAADTSSDIFYLAPWFLPDGKHFFYSTNTKPMVVTERSTDKAIFIGSLGSEERRQLISGASNAVAANGHVLFIRDNTLVAQQFNPETFELSGDLATVAEQVQYSERNGIGEFTVSQNGQLVYQNRTSNLGGILSLYGREGNNPKTIASTSGYDDPVFSPDGSRMAFTQYEGSGSSGDIWITELSRGTTSRFTFDSAEEDDPVWSADGSNMVFSYEGDLAMKPANGLGEMQFLYRSKTDKVPTDWSLDGKYLAFGDFGGKTGRDIWMLPMTGERKPVPFAVTKFNEQGAHFSPDGKWIAYSSNETGGHEVYIQSFPASSGKWQISTKGGTLPQWTATGRDLFYIDADNQLMSVKINMTGSSLQAGTPVALFKTKLVFTSGPGHRYDVSQDGRQFIINDVEEGEFRSEPLNLVLNWPTELNVK